MKKLISVLLLALAPMTVYCQDLKGQLDIVTAIKPHSNATDIESAVINSDNYMKQLIHVSSSPASYTADNKLEVYVSHCDTEVGTYTYVEPYDVIGDQIASGGVVLTLDEELAQQGEFKILYTGRRKYIKVKCDYSGTLSTAPTVYVDLIQGGKILQK